VFIVITRVFSALPCHCLLLYYGFFGFAIISNLARDLTLMKIGKHVPLLMAMVVPFLMEAYFTTDICIEFSCVYLA